MNLFQRKEFIGSGGQPLTWKIECDALTAFDWETIAFVCSERVPPFGSIQSIPTGGLPLAVAMMQYVDTTSDAKLIVDDVWTTGKSMLTVRNNLVETHYGEIFGLVAFARSYTPPWVTCFAKV